MRSEVEEEIVDGSSVMLQSSLEGFNVDDAPKIQNFVSFLRYVGNSVNKV